MRALSREPCLDRPRRSRFRSLCFSILLPLLAALAACRKPPQSVAAASSRSPAAEAEATQEPQPTAVGRSWFGLPPTVHHSVIPYPSFPPPWASRRSYQEAPSADVPAELRLSVVHREFGDQGAYYLFVELRPESAPAISFALPAEASRVEMSVAPGSYSVSLHRWWCDGMCSRVLVHGGPLAKKTLTVSAGESREVLLGDADRVPGVPSSTAPELSRVRLHRQIPRDTRGLGISGWSVALFYEDHFEENRRPRHVIQLPWRVSVLELSGIHERHARIQTEWIGPEPELMTVCKIAADDLPATTKTITVPDPDHCTKAQSRWPIRLLEGAP